MGLAPAREPVVIHHPLQPFDVRNFTTGGWSCDARRGASTPSHSTGARASVAPGRPPCGRSCRDRLPPAASDLVELDDLVRFVQHPVKAFLRQRLGIAIRDRRRRAQRRRRRSSSTRWSSGASASVSSRAAWPASTPTACSIRRAGTGHAAAGGARRRVARQRRCDGGAPRRRGGAGGLGGAGRSSTEVHVDLGGGRLLAGTVRGIVGEAVRLRDVLASRAEAPPGRMGALPGTRGRRTRPARSEQC